MDPERKERKKMRLEFRRLNILAAGALLALCSGAAFALPPSLDAGKITDTSDGEITFSLEGGQVGTAPPAIDRIEEEGIKLPPASTGEEAGSPEKEKEADGE